VAGCLQRKEQKRKDNDCNYHNKPKAYERIGLTLDAGTFTEYHAKLAGGKEWKLIAITGTYATNNSVTEVYITVIFGVIGYLMKHADLPAAPIIMGIVLGPLLETHFRRALIISNGAYSTFFLHPVSAIFLCAAIVSILYPFIRWALKRSAKA
jgi:hypothetical protein